MERYNAMAVSVLIMLLAIFTIDFSALAQSGKVDDENSQKGIQVGANLGVNSVWLVNQYRFGEAELEYRPTYGLNYQINAGYNFTDHIGLMTGIHKTNMGQNYRDMVKNQVLDRQLELNYLSIPIMAKYMSGVAKTQFYAMGGVQFGFLTSNEYQRDGLIVKPSDIVAGSSTSTFFEDQDFGVRFEMGTNIKIYKSLFLDAGMQFYWGLSDINKTELRRDYVDYPYEKTTNAFGGFNLGVHYIFK